MALILCPNCKTMNDTEGICPECGHRLTKEQIAEISKKGESSHGGSLWPVAVVVALFFFCSLYSPNDRSGSLSPTDPASLSLFKEEVADTLSKTQIYQHFIAAEIPTEENLRVELRKLFASASVRTGFKYNNPANRVAIYVYASVEQARAGPCCWIGMVHGATQNLTGPEILIDSERMSALAAPQRKVAGRAEPLRKEIFRAILGSETRATRDARARASSSVSQQMDLEADLIEQYHGEVRDPYQLTEEQYYQIVREGIVEGWDGPE